jgi:hypothetical protein
MFVIELIMSSYELGRQESGHPKSKFCVNELPSTIESVMTTATIYEHDIESRFDYSLNHHDSAGNRA